MRYFFHLLVALPSFGFCQFDVAMPPAPGSEKTAFRLSVFQANYLTQKTLVKFLDQSHEEISDSSKTVELHGEDLYYKNSADYRKTKKLDYWVNEIYLMTDQRKLEILDSALNISKKWRASIVKDDDLLGNILNTIFRGAVLSVKKNTIYAIIPESENRTYQPMYKFEFNKQKSIIASKYGYLRSRTDSLFWKTSTFEYRNKQLYKKVDKICNGERCLSGYELITKIYSGDLILKETKQSFSRKDNELYTEEVKTFHHEGGMLDSVRTNTYYIKDTKKQLINTSIENYSDGHLLTREYHSLIPSFNDIQKSHSDYQYDEKNRLVLIKFEAWNKDSMSLEKRTEKYEYQKNKYIYTYKELFKTENGKEKLPLQYKLTYSFF